MVLPSSTCAACRPLRSSTWEVLSASSTPACTFWASAAAERTRSTTTSVAPTTASTGMDSVTFLRISVMRYMGFLLVSPRVVRGVGPCDDRRLAVEHSVDGRVGECVGERGRFLGRLLGGFFGADVLRPEVRAELAQHLLLPRRQALVGVDGRLEAAPGLLGEDPGADVEGLGRDLQTLGDLLEDLGGRTSQAALDLTEIGVADTGERRELAHGELGVLALLAQIRPEVADPAGDACHGFHSASYS